MRSLCLQLCAILMTLAFAAPAMAAVTGGSIGLYWDAEGTSCVADIPAFEVRTFYILAAPDPLLPSGGITGAEFRVKGATSQMIITPTANPASNVALGNPFSDESQPQGSRGGANIAFPTCQTPDANGFVLLYTVSILLLSVEPDIVFEVDMRDPPSNSNRSFPYVNACDSPLFTPHEVSTENIAYMNHSNPVPCPGDFPPPVFRDFSVGVYADSTGTEGPITVPRFVPTTVLLLGDSTLVSGAEFRLEITNPEGFSFTYNPPPGASVVGSLFDLDAADPNNPAGATILLDGCDGEPTGLSSFGTVEIISFAGLVAEIRVKAKVPIENPLMPCPRFFLCDPPLLTPVCMEINENGFAGFVATVISSGAGIPQDVILTFVDSTETVDLTWSPPVGETPPGYNVYRSTSGSSFMKVNGAPLASTAFVDTPSVGGVLCYEVTAVDALGDEGVASQEACSSVFIAESLELDLQLGEACSTVASLFLGRDFRVTVQGTASVWEAGAWSLPNVVCGVPDATPMTPSPGATNYWAGIDGEILFSEPLPPGTDCATQTIPRHHGAFLIDSGSGASHVEPLGGGRTSPAPGHLYTYVVQGQGTPVRFSWSGNDPALSYGVFKITVEEIDVATDVLETTVPAANHRIVAVPNPFNPRTEIRYSLSQPGNVSVAIFDVRGRLVQRLFNGPRALGQYSVTWDGRSLTGHTSASGTYYVRVVSAQGASTGKLTLLK